MGTRLSTMALLTLLLTHECRRWPQWTDRATGKPITAHGFRATLKTWADEVATPAIRN